MEVVVRETCFDASLGEEVEGRQIRYPKTRSPDAK
jgi:hypothetical protein